MIGMSMWSLVCGRKQWWVTLPCCCVAPAAGRPGTGLKEGVSLLESMLNDSTDFVRQGASIALALVLVQQPESVVEPFRKKVGC